MKHLRWRRYKVVNFRRFRSGQLFCQPNYTVCDTYIIYYVISYQMWYYVCITWYYYQLYYDCIMSPVLCCMLFSRSLPVSVLASRTSTSIRVSLSHMAPAYSHAFFAWVSLSHMAPAKFASNFRQSKSLTNVWRESILGEQSTWKKHGRSEI